MNQTEERPYARCPANEVEAFYFPFYIKKGVGVEPDFLLLDIHLFHMTSEEKAVMGELIEVTSADQLRELGFPEDDRGVFVIGEDL